MSLECRVVSGEYSGILKKTGEVKGPIVGCSKRKHVKLLPSPQIKMKINNKNWKGNVWEYVDRESRIARCLLCNKEGKYGTIQQHCKQHFLPEYHCCACGDSWHLKTQWQEHFHYKCNVCSKTIKGGQNYKKHMKLHETN